MEILAELGNMKSALTTYDINAYRIPCNIIDMSQEGADLFNKIYFYVKNMKGINKLLRTPSGGISCGSKLLTPAYDVRTTKTSIELTIVLCTRCWRIQFRTNFLKHKETAISGAKAFQLFKKNALAFGIDLEDYAVENGQAIKDTIAKPRIELGNEYIVDKVFINNVHHIDFHSSYPAGLAITHPEFRPMIEELYERRNEDPIYKAMLNFSIGYMQSIGGCKARYAALSRDAIHNNNERIEELTKRLSDSGRFIILYNTDGIWYKGDEYHGEGEGDHLGQWSNDHHATMFRAKSAGAYEYVEDEQYYPVLRGRTKLDNIKPREQWKWGDIYSNEASVIQFYWDEENGVTNGL